MTLVPKVMQARYAPVWVLVISALSWGLSCLLMYVIFFRHLFVHFRWDSYSPSFTIPMAVLISGFFIIGDICVYQRVTLWSIVLAVGLNVVVMLLLAGVLYVGLAGT